MSIKTRLDKLEAIAEPVAGIAQLLKEARERHLRGEPAIPLKTEAELNEIIATSKDKLAVRVANIQLDRLRARSHGY